MNPSLLSAEGIEAGYGDVRVLHGASIAVETGAVTALVGSNGAGKTTLLRTLAGLLPATRGRIMFDGRDITSQRASERVEAGIALVPEGRLIFPDFTVEENLLAGAFVPRVRSRRMALLHEMFDRYPILRERRRQAGGTLSGGQQQMLAIARGLMSCPRVMLLDEPSLGLAPLAVRSLFQTIEEIASAGVSVLIVEQNVRSTLERAGSAFVLENGVMALSGRASDLLDDGRVRQAYLGL